MALTDEQKQALYDKFIEFGKENRGPLGNFGKQDLKDAIRAIDQWVEDNQVSYNSAIPLPCRTELTQKQKVILLMYVVNRRWEVL